MAAERKPGSNRGRPSLDWNVAFLYYAALPPERRDYATVAAEFGVSARTVERHGREERWRERARELDREAAASAAARLVEKRAETSADLLRLIEATLIGYAQDLRAGKVRLSAADLPRLYKLLRELWEPGELPLAAQPDPPAPEKPADSLEHKRAVLRALGEVLLPEAEREHERLEGGEGERDQGGGRDGVGSHGEEGGGR
jgi:hypothetical protein